MTAEPTTQVPLVPDKPLQGVLMTVDLDDLTPNAEIRGDDPTPAFIRSIKDWGVMEPITITDAPHGPYTYRVIDGGRRVKSARHNNFLEIQAVYYNHGTLEWRAELALIANELRSPNARAQLADLAELAQDHGIDAIVEKTQMRKGTVKAKLKLLHLIPRLLDAFYDGSMAVGAAQEACSLPSEMQERLVAILDEPTGKPPRLTKEDVHRVRQVQVELVTDELDLGDAISLANTYQAPDPKRQYLDLLESAFHLEVGLTQREQKSLKGLIAKAVARL